MILKDELKACLRSKRKLCQQLSETEGNMLAIIGKYREELNLAVAQENRLVDDYAKVLAEKEARGKVIDSLHGEAMMWMDRFDFTSLCSKQWQKSTQPLMKFTSSSTIVNT